MFVTFSAAFTVVSICGGSFVGGVMTKQVNLTPRACALIMLIAQLPSFALQTVTLFMSCDQPQIHNWSNQRYSSMLFSLSFSLSLSLSLTLHISLYPSLYLPLSFLSLSLSLSLSFSLSFLSLSRSLFLSLFLSLSLSISLSLSSLSLTPPIASHSLSSCAYICICITLCTYFEHFINFLSWMLHVILVWTSSLFFLTCIKCPLK